MEWNESTLFAAWTGKRAETLEDLSWSALIRNGEQSSDILHAYLRFDAACPVGIVHHTLLPSLTHRAPCHRSAIFPRFSSFVCEVCCGCCTGSTCRHHTHRARFVAVCCRGKRNGRGDTDDIASKRSDSGGNRDEHVITRRHLR